MSHEQTYPATSRAPPRGSAPAGNTALAALAHPLALAGAAALLLNALVFQRLWPSWWTGKLGDLAWLLIAPLLAAVPLCALFPGRRLSPRAFAAWLCLPVALAFAVVKAVPGANSALLALGASLGLALKLRLDPSDLLALPAVLGAAWIWGHPWPPRLGAARRLLPPAALALAALAVLADAGAPTDFGINCLMPDRAPPSWPSVRFFSPGDFGSTTNKTVYRSDDAGLTWRLDPQADPKKLACVAIDPWPVADPSSPQRQLFYVPGQGIYHSSDQGQTLQFEQPFKNVDDYEMDTADNHLIVAAGRDGIWLKTSAGDWQQTLNLTTP